MESKNAIDINSDLFDLFSNLLENKDEIEILKVILSERDEIKIYENFLEKFKRGNDDQA